MRRSASEILNELEMRVARLEKQSAFGIDMKEVKRYFRNLEGVEYRDENGDTKRMGGRILDYLLEDILKAAQEKKGDIDGFMEAIDEINDDYFNTRSYGPDHNAQDKLYSLAEDFADDHIG